MLDTITDGTRRVLAFARQANIKHFLFVSSGAIYGKQPVDCTNVDESFASAIDPLQSGAAYAVGKLYAEQMCQIYAKQFNLPVTIARCFAFVGPISILGDGSPRRSYLYAADLVIWLWTLLCFGESGVAYNVGADESVSIAELAKLVSQQVEPPLAMTIAKTRNNNDPVERYVPCTKRARSAFNLDAWVSLPDAIHRTILWNQTNAKSQ